MSMLLAADLDVIRSGDIVTGRYQQFRREWGVPVRTTVGAPRFWRRDELGSLEFASKVAPWKLLSLPEDEFTERYLARLDAHEADVIAQVAGLVIDHLGERLVLLCYDDVHGGEWCHRRMFAGWMEQRHGIVIPEYPPM